MSTMPVTPGPVSVPGTPATDLLAAAGGAVALGNAPASETGAGFLALVQQALHLVDGESAPGQAGTGDVAQDASTGEDQDPTAAAETGDLAALMNLVPLIPGLPVTPVPVATGTGGDAPSVAAAGAATATATGPAVTATAVREAKAAPAPAEVPATGSDDTAATPDAPVAATPTANDTPAPAPAVTSPAPSAPSAAPAATATA
ncbi:hypothetical protein AB4Y76_20125, partial [Marmoricola sp. RAF53]